MMPPQLAQMMKAKPEAPASLEFTPPEGLDLTPFKEGEEAELVCTLKMANGKLTLDKVQGIPIQATEGSPEEEAAESPEEEDVEMAAEEASEEDEEISPGDRFMKKFKPKPKQIGIGM